VVVLVDPNYDLAWAAGFFDGEGTTSYLKSNNWIGPRMSLTQKNEDTLKRFLNVVGFGKIYKNNTRVGMFCWACQRKEDVNTILNKLWPFLSEQKKNQALSVYNLCTGL
jgi:hypothetical protein